MKGYSIAGTSETRDRVENDFYATPEESTKAFAWFVWEIGYKGKPNIEWI